MDTDNMQPKDRIALQMEPLCVSREEGAKLCSITPGTWDRWRRLGLLPDSIPGTERWLLEQIRQRLRERCGMTGVAPANGLPRGKFSDVGKYATRGKAKRAM